MIHGGESCAHIEDIIIDSTYRGESYGKILIDYMIEKAKKKNCYKIKLSCDQKNIGFYKKCGFNQVNVEMCMYFN